MGDLLSVALIIAVAAAIGVSYEICIQDTIVFWVKAGCVQPNPGIVGVIAYVFYLPLSIIIPSSSGLAAASMPIIAPVVGGIAGREVAIVAFATAWTFEYDGSNYRFIDGRTFDRGRFTRFG